MDDNEVIVNLPPAQPRGDGSTKEYDNFVPRFMCTSVMAAFGAVPLAIFGITEYLVQTCQNRTGLFRAESGETRLVFRDTVAQFFGLFVVLLVGVYFQDMDQTVKTMEPYYHLSKPNGALGRDSLCVDYFRIPIYFTPYAAYQHRHWAVLISASAAVISTSILPTLALGLFVTDDSDPERMAMHPGYTRSFQAFLGLLSVLTAILCIMIRRRNSGLNQFPRRFLTPYLYTRRQSQSNSLYTFITSNFREPDTGSAIEHTIGATEEVVVDEKFSGQRFRLKRPDGVPMSDHPEIVTFSEGEDERSWCRCSCLRLSCFDLSRLIPDGWTAFREKYLWRDDHPALFQTVPLSALSIVLLALFVIAPGQPIWAQNSRFFTFIGDKRFARSAVSTLVCNVIWNQFDRNAKMMEPLYQMLSLQGAPMDLLETEYMTMWPFQDLFVAARRLHKKFRFRQSKKQPRYNSILSDFAFTAVLNGTYAGIFFSTFWNILALSGDINLVTLSFLIASEVVMLNSLCFIFRYRRKPVVPRQPVTIASCLLYIYASDLSSQKELIPSENTPPPGTPTHRRKPETISAEQTSTAQRTQSIPGRGSTSGQDKQAGTPDPKGDDPIGSVGPNETIGDPGSPPRSKPTAACSSRSTGVEPSTKSPPGAADQGHHQVEEQTDEMDDLEERCAFGRFEAEGKEHIGISKLESRREQYIWQRRPAGDVEVGLKTGSGNERIEFHILEGQTAADGEAQTDIAVKTGGEV